jgi:hypothetical protein
VQKENKKMLYKYFLDFVSLLSEYPSHIRVLVKVQNRDSSVSIATGYGLNGRGSIPGRRKVSFFTPLGPTQPHIQWVQEAHPPGTKLTRSPLSSDKVKNSEAMLPLPHTSSWRGALLIKHRDFTFSIVKDHLKRIVDQNGSVFNLVLKYSFGPSIKWLVRLEYKM